MNIYSSLHKPLSTLVLYLLAQVPFYEDVTKTASVEGMFMMPSPSQ